MKIYNCKCEKPIVSIISLVYNHEQYLETMIKSLVSQKTDFEFEIIFHDDASTDNSLKILLDYQKKYPEIITVISEDTNMYFDPNIRIVRDIILPKARGKYIAFCEGDDFWCSLNKLQAQVNFLENNSGYSGCVHPSYVVDDNGDKTGEIIFLSKTEYDIEKLDSYLRFPQTTSYMCLNPNGVKFGKIQAIDFIYGWDKNFAIYMIRLGKVHFLPEIMSCYRHITTKGTSSEARENLHNLTLDKIKAEMDLYKQLCSYQMLEEDPYYYSDPYCNNITMYSLHKFQKEPTFINLKLLYAGFSKSPYPKWVMFNFLLKRMAHKLKRIIKHGREIK